MGPEHELREMREALRAERQRLEKMAAELEATRGELEAFSYSVSHDLREPLRAISGFSRALEEDFESSLPSEARRYLSAIREGALRMGRLLDGLLAFSRLAREPIRRHSVDTQQLVEECLLEIEKGATKLPTICLGELRPCQADPALLRQVFVHLLGNALKFSRLRQPPALEVGSRLHERGETLFFVRDNGVGFDMRYAPKLFRIFSRLHREEEFEGTGVGLAIVHRIVTLHGGRVWADAAPEQGATFSFTLGGERD